MIKLIMKITNSSEKYGRILGWIYLDGSDTSINDEMIQKGYAWSYMGDTKIKNFSELLAKRNENK